MVSAIEAWRNTAIFPPDDHDRTMLVYGLLKVDDTDAIAQVYLAYPGTIERTKGNIYSHHLVPLVEALDGHADRRVDVVAQVMEERKFGDFDILAGLRRVLSNDEQRDLVARVGDVAAHKLLAAGFARPAMLAPPLPAIEAADLERLLGRRTTTPPAVTALMETLGFDARLAALSRGEAAITADERSIVASAIRGLSKADVAALQKTLVSAAGKRVKGQEILRKKPSVQSVMALLSGALFGARPKASDELIALATEALERLRLDDDEDPKAWMDLLCASDTAVSLTKESFRARTTLEAFTLEDLDAIDLGLSRPSWEQEHPRYESLGQLTGYDAGADAKRYLDRVGPKAFERTLDIASVVKDPPRELARHLDMIRFRPTSAADELGFETMIDVMTAIHADPYAARCVYATASDTANPFVDLARGKSAKQIEHAFRRSASQVADFSSDGRPLLIWSGWPADVEVTGASAKTIGEASERIRAMKADLAERAPAQAKELERELLGRSFVSHHRYEALYEKGANAPEHAYFVETFDGWCEAKFMLDAAAAQTRGQPLEAGELTELIRQAHTLAAAPMVRRENLPEGAVGVFRPDIAPRDLPLIFSGSSFQWSEAKVYTGGGELSPDELATLEANDMVTVHVREPDDPHPVTEGQVGLLGIELAAVGDVPKLMEELDAWVRENEGHIPPEELAAQVHHHIVAVHPFLDGNGRVAKLVANFLLARAGVEPAIWKQRNVLLHRGVWDQAVHEGVQHHLDVVGRHWHSAFDV